MCFSSSSRTRPRGAKTSVASATCASVAWLPLASTVMPFPIRQGVFGIARRTGVSSPNKPQKARADAGGDRENEGPLAAPPKAFDGLRDVLRLDAQDHEIGSSGRFRIRGGARHGQLRRDLLGARPRPCRGPDLLRFHPAGLEESGRV